MYTDGHCHLSRIANVSELLKEGRNKGISSIVMAGTDPEDWKAQLQISGQFTETHFLLNFGIHPWFQPQEKSLEKQQLETLEDLVSLKKCQGLGEIGLDFFRTKSEQDRKSQEDLFQGQLQIAAKHDLPVVLHCVKAFHRLDPILRTADHGKGMIHDFMGNTGEAKKILNLGYSISLSPRCLKGSREDLFKFIPKDRLILESDCEGNEDGTARGHITDILLLAQKLSPILGEDQKTLLSNSKENIQKIYGIKESLSCP